MRNEETKLQWYVGSSGVVHKEKTTLYSEPRDVIGNSFGTEEEAELAVRKLKAWKRLKDKGFVFKGINMLDGSIKTGLSKGVSLADCEGFYDDMRLLFGGEE